MKDNEVIKTTENDTLEVQKEFLKERNSVTSLILILIIIAAVVTFIVIKGKPMTLSKAFDNTFNVDNLTYKVDYLLEAKNGKNDYCPDCSDNVLIDFNKSIYKVNDYFVYYSENKTIYGISDEIIGSDNKKFDYIFSYYTDSNNYVTYIDNLFNGLNTYGYEISDDLYKHKLDGKESYNYLEILPKEYEDYFEDAVPTRVEIKLNKDHVDYIKLFYEIGDTEYYNLIKFTHINETNIDLSDKVVKEAYKTYYHFLPSIRDGENNSIYYVMKNKECEEDTDVKNVELEFKYFDYLDYPTLNVEYCSGNTEYFEYYVENISNNTGLDHSDDAYAIKDRYTDKKIANFTYDSKKNTIKVYNGDIYNGTYKEK